MPMDKPDINKHWCKYCRIHGEYRIKKTTYSSDSGTNTNIHYMCTKCEKEMFIPQDIYQISHGKLITKIILFLGAVALSMGLIFRGLTSFFVYGWILIGVIATGLLVGYTLELYYRRFYYEWEKWAKERKLETNNNCVNFKKELSDFKAQEDKRSEIQTKSLMKGFGCVILFMIGFFLFGLVLLALVLGTVDNY